jgi:hypothetical protein
MTDTTVDDRSDVPLCTWQQQALLEPKSIAGRIEKRLIERFAKVSSTQDGS